MPVANRRFHTCTQGLEVRRLSNLVDALRKENAEFIRENERLWREVQRLSTPTAAVVQASRPALVPAVDLFDNNDREKLLDEIDRLRCIIYATPR